jgi:homoserine kinase
MSTPDQQSATAFAPATVGNVAVGFDILGFATDSVGDTVTVHRIDEPTVEIGEITGVVTDLPTKADENTATVGLVQLIAECGLDFGFRVDIEKGIPLGSGMGGSAASAVAAIVAAAELCDQELSRKDLLSYALLGESVASGEVHGDNVTPCLYGGLTLTRSLEPIDVIEIPVPDDICCVLVNPKQRIDTFRARQVIPKELPLKVFVHQSANLAGFISACYRGDIELLRRSLRDMLIEPHRAPLIKGFGKVRHAALEEGALGCSISGSGPSVFAWVENEKDGERVREAMVEAFSHEGVDASAWISPVSCPGAHLTEDHATESKGPRSEEQAP